MGERLPGPICGTKQGNYWIDEGTMCLARSNSPGSIGIVATPVAAYDVDVVGVNLSGGIPFAVGQASMVRIPVPGTNGLAIELSPRGYVPASGSTSTLFFQDPTGKRHLRLDYGYNVKTKTIDYHWNQKGTFTDFSVADHTSVGRAGQTAYKAAKYFRYGGRVLVVVGVAVDVISIVQASKPLRRASEVVAGWAGAWVGCKVIGAGGAFIGTAASPLGTAVGGIGGCIIGGIGGYLGGSILAAEVYDWAEDTFFTPLPEMSAP